MLCIVMLEIPQCHPVCLLQELCTLYDYWTDLSFHFKNTSIPADFHQIETGEMGLFYEKQIQKVAVNHSLNCSLFILSNKSMSEQIADGICMVSRRSADFQVFQICIAEINCKSVGFHTPDAGFENCSH